MIQFDGHTATVCSLAFSPDSMTLASGAKDGGVKLWDAAGGPAGNVVVSQPGVRKALAWSPTGDALATGCQWRMTLFRGGPEWRERACPAIAGDVTTLTFLAPHLLAVGTVAGGGGHPGRLHLWDPVAHASRPVPPTIHGAAGVRSAIAHPLTKYLHWIAGVPKTTACVWRSWCITSPNATEVKLNKPAADIAVSPDGGTVAIASEWLVRVFTYDCKPRTELSGHKGQVPAVGFIHGGRTVVSASWDETVRFWDVATGKETARFPLTIGKLTALAVSPDGTRVAVGGTDGPIVVIDAE
jgi:WD40 repeat protein